MQPKDITKKFAKLVKEYIILKIQNRPPEGLFQAATKELHSLCKINIIRDDFWVVDINAFQIVPTRSSLPGYSNRSKLTDATNFTID